MIKRFATILALLLLAAHTFSQTNPAAQTLPFGLTAQTGNTLPAGVAVHKFAAAPTSRILTPGTLDLIYTATSASGGWKDEATSGISVLASGSQAAGAWIVAINTTGKTNIQVQWTARLMLQQASWDNNVALQYRVGTSGNFIDIGTTSTYSSTGQTAGNSQAYSEPCLQQQKTRRWSR